jgi:hypothetical protein
VLSTHSRAPMVAAAIAAAAIAATAGLASPANDSQPFAGVTVDQSAVARHRALGHLGAELHVVSDSTVIARHQALGRLPAVSVGGTTPAETSASGWFPWRESLLGVAVVTACLLIGFAFTRSGRLRTRGTA